MIIKIRIEKSFFSENAKSYDELVFEGGFGETNELSETSEKGDGSEVIKTDFKKNMTIEYVLFALILLITTLILVRIYEHKKKKGI